MAGMSCEGCGAEATCYCQDCPSLLCPPCLRKHAATSVFSSHRVLDLTRQTDKNSVVRYILCPDHHILINYYCHSCQRGTCRQCMPRSHTDHNAEPLSQLTVTCRDNLNDAIKNLQALAADLLKTEALPSELQARGTSTLTEAEDRFKQHQEHCQAAMVDWEQRTLTDLAERQGRLDKDVEMITSRRMEYMSEIKAVEGEVHGLLVLDRPLEVVERMDDVLKKVQGLKDKSVDVQRGTYVRAAEFVPDTIPPTMGDFKEVTIGPGSDRERLTYWTKAGRGSGLGELLSPCDVLLLPGGELVLADWGNSRIQRFLSCGEMPAILLQDLNPERLAATPDGLLLVTDDKRRAVLSFTAQGGKVVQEWRPPEVQRPWGLAINVDSSRVVTDYAKSTCHVYSPDEVLLASFGGYSSFREQEPWMLNLPTYVCCDLHGRILISDCNNHAIKIFDKNGQFLSSFGTRGVGDGQLRYPRGICIDNCNNIVVADWGNDRISQFSPDGKFIRQVFSKDMAEQFGWPYGLSYLSGAFDDGKPRLAVTTEGPDALLTIPYHNPEDTFVGETDIETALDRSCKNHNTEEEDNNIFARDSERSDSSTKPDAGPDNDPETRHRPNRRKTSHGSGTGRPRSGADSVRTSSSSPVSEHSEQAARQKNDTLPLESEDIIKSPSGTPTISSRKTSHRAGTGRPRSGADSVRSSSTSPVSEHSEQAASRNDTTLPSKSEDIIKSPSGTPSISSHIDPSAESNWASSPSPPPSHSPVPELSDTSTTDILNSTYTPSIQSKPKRKIKSSRRAKEEKDRLNDESLESIPEKLDI